jgi:hypothetical protein
MMKNINFKELFKRNWIHLAAFATFFLVTYLYFQPQFSGHALKQHDIEQFQGMAHETKMFRELHGEEPLWTNSMFGGMPTYQISTKYPGNWMIEMNNMFRLWLNSPAGMFFLYLICFYIMGLMMRVRPLISGLGAFAFAFSSYFIIILQAGHNTKAAAIALAAPVIGAFYMAFRHNIKWGTALSALFLGMQVAANHLQITYYLAFVLLFMGVGELIRAAQKKELPRFLKTIPLLLVAYALGTLVNLGNLTLTNDYAKYTIRGGNDITITPEGLPNDEDQTGDGLSKDYILQWSNGIGESFTMLSPYVKGGASGRVKDSPFADKLKKPDYRNSAKLISENNMYWGDQIFVSGPVYLGVIVVLLALLALAFARGPLRWTIFAVSVLCLMLAWGSNFMWFSDLFLDYVPGYNKFRAVTIILSIIGLTVPLLAVLFLNQMVEQKEYVRERIMRFFIVSGAFVGLLGLLTVTGLGDGFLSEQENEFISNYEERVREQILAEDPQMLLTNYGIDVSDERVLQDVISRQSEDVNKQFDALISFRGDVYKNSMLRSILFSLVGIGLLLAFFYTSIPWEAVIGGLLVFILIDLVQVDLNYLNSEKKGKNYTFWMDIDKYHYPHYPTGADIQVFEREIQQLPELQTKINEIDQKTGRNGMSDRERWGRKFMLLNFATNYRVYEPQGALSSARASFFHKSIGGYHGAKLRSIQNLFEFHLGRGNMEMLNMLNVRYILQGEQMQYNPGAYGNAWLVRNIAPLATRNEELLYLGSRFRLEAKSQDVSLRQGETSLTSFEGSQAELSRVQAFIGNDAIDLEKALRSGVPSVYVADANGTTNWIPATVLKQDTLNSFAPLLEVEPLDPFNARETAVINEKDQPSSLLYSGEGSISLKSYLPNHLVYTVDIPSETQFAVFSEIYYPDGWKATIDGKEVDLKRVNYLLRGVELPQGQYALEMKFEPAKYAKTNTLALIVSLIIVFGIIGLAVTELVRSKN